MTVLSYKIGTTYGGMVNVETLSTTKPNMAPRSQYYAYAETIQTGARSYTTRGNPFTTWYWGFMPKEMFNSLRTLCPGASAAIYIDTLKEDRTTYEHYTAIMVWPDPNELEFNFKDEAVNITIKFINLAVYTP